MIPKNKDFVKPFLSKSIGGSVFHLVDELQPANQIVEPSNNLVKLDISLPETSTLHFLKDYTFPENRIEPTALTVLEKLDICKQRSHATNCDCSYPTITGEVSHDKHQ